jgi:hypothetical protein
MTKTDTVGADEKVSAQVPVAAVERAMEFIKTGDTIGWKRILLEIKMAAQVELKGWREKHEREANRGNYSTDAFLEPGLAIFSPLISVVLLGVESGKDGFMNEAGILDDIIYPTGWKYHGSTEFLEFPLVAGAVYQVLHGAFCLKTSQVALAAAVVDRPIADYHNFSTRPNQSAWIKVGQLGGTYLTPIRSLFETWSWIPACFGCKEEFESALCAYGCLLNVLDYCENLTSHGVGGSSKFSIRTYPFSMEERFKRKAYSMLIRSPSEMRQIWRSKGISDEDFYKAWIPWVQASAAQISRFNIMASEGILHRMLAEDLIG